MTIEELKKRKRELGYSNEMLAKISGVPLGTLQKVFSGFTRNPRRDTILKLEKALCQETPDAFVYSSSPRPVQMVCESASPYGSPVKKQGEYTLNDYYALPDERRVELIDGVIYDMAASSVRHQLILFELSLQFRECAEKHCPDCTVFLSPCDVQLDKDDRTMLQPDLFVVCGPFDRDARSIFGAPDLTVEVLSPATRSKDMLLKLHKYQNAGVKEYWVVDPDFKTVLVYDFSDDSFYPGKYDFYSKIPIRLSGGKCVIDFAEISRAAFA